MIVTALLVAWVFLVAFAVWEATSQRPGTSDELRTLAAVLAALIIAAGLSVLGALPANAHDGHEIEAWLEDWTGRLPAGGLSAGSPLVEELADFKSRHTWYFNPAPEPARETPRRSGPSVPYNVEAWRPLVAQHFAAGDVDRALCLIHHESRGNPSARNPRSSAEGLFQILAFWEDAYGLDRSDPAQNVELAAIVRDVQGWAAWSPYNRGLCR